MAQVRPSSDSPDRFGDSPIAWFGEMVLAWERFDIERAAEAMRQLTRLGWLIKYRKPRTGSGGKGAAR